VLAAAVLAEHLAPIQLAGGALVLTAVLVLRVGPRDRAADKSARSASSGLLAETN
jgi:drug/metabolite transporter (DMT)-like permease